MNPELATFKYHPRIMEMRLALIKNLLARQYGDEMTASLLQSLATMFQCNWSILNGIFNKDYRILNHPALGTLRKKQEIVFMGELYGETRYRIANTYLNMSPNYLYQSKEKFNFNSFVDEEWLRPLNDEVVVCGVKAYAMEAKRFLVAFEAFTGIFK